MRSDREILDRIKARQEGDLFGFEWHEYVSRLPLEQFRQFAKADADLSDYEPTPRDRDSLIAEMKDYMEFAWEKANNNRGISANRSVMHYVAWTWLAGDDSLSNEISDLFDTSYCFYGKPILVRVCKAYGWDWRQWDDDRWTNYECEDGMTADRALASLAA